MNSLCRLWRGELALRDAFWNWAVIGGALVNAATSLLFLVLMSAEYPVAAFVAGYALSVPYNLLAAVGVWRSAAHYAGERHWAELSRIVTVVGMLLLSIT